jgi:hypothetical protein
MKRRGFLQAIGLAPLAALLGRKAAAEPVQVEAGPDIYGPVMLSTEHGYAGPDYTLETFDLDPPNVPGMPGYAWRETKHCGHPAYVRRHDGLLVFTLNGRDWWVERTPGSRVTGVIYPSALAACQAADMADLTGTNAVMRGEVGLGFRLYPMRADAKIEAAVRADPSPLLREAVKVLDREKKR